MTFLYDVITFTCEVMQVFGWWAVAAIVIGVPVAFAISATNGERHGHE